MNYVLVLWPETQQLMEMDWFGSECYLCQAFGEQEHHDSAYFIPKERYEEYQTSHGVVDVNQENDK